MAGLVPAISLQRLEEVDPRTTPGEDEEGVIPDGASRSGIACRTERRNLHTVIPAKAGIHNHDVLRRANRVALRSASSAVMDPGLRYAAPG